MQQIIGTKKSDEYRKDMPFDVIKFVNSPQGGVSDQSEERIKK
jgi:hypothetical protein